MTDSNITVQSNTELIKSLNNVNATTGQTLAELNALNVGFTLINAQLLLSTVALTGYNTALSGSLVLQTLFNGSVETGTAGIFTNCFAIGENIGMLGLASIALTEYIGLLGLAFVAQTLFNGSVGVGTFELLGNTTALIANTVALFANLLAATLVTAVFWLFTAALAVNQALSGIDTAQTINSIAASKMQIGAIIGQTIAQWALNGAMVTGILLASAGTGIATVGTAIVAGAATTVVGVAGTAAIGSLAMAALATGGIVNRPTVAMVGEGRYPEAVVPLGDSPQFASMKADIANAVVQAMRLMPNVAGGSDKTGAANITLNVDGQAFARLVMPQLKKEGYRNGFDIAVKGV